MQIRARKIFPHAMTVGEKLKLSLMGMAFVGIILYLFLGPGGGPSLSPSVVSYLDDPLKDTDIPERRFDVADVQIPPEALNVVDGSEGHRDLAYAAMIYQAARADQGQLEAMAGTELVPSALLFERPELFRGHAVRLTGTLVYFFDISLFDSPDPSRRNRLEELARDTLASDPPTWADLGFERAAAGDYAGADAAWTRALQLAPDFDRALAGKLLLASGVRTVWRGALAFWDPRDHKEYMYRFDILDKHREFPTARNTPDGWGALVDLSGFFYKMETYPTETGSMTLPVVVGRRLIRLRPPTLQDVYPAGLLLAGIGFSVLVLLLFGGAWLWTRRTQRKFGEDARAKLLQLAKRELQGTRGTDLRMLAQQRAIKQSLAAGPVEPPAGAGAAPAAADAIARVSLAAGPGPAPAEAPLGTVPAPAPAATTPAAPGVPAEVPPAAPGEPPSPARGEPVESRAADAPPPPPEGGGDGKAPASEPAGPPAGEPVARS